MKLKKKIVSQYLYSTQGGRECFTNIWSIEQLYFGSEFPREPKYYYKKKMGNVHIEEF